MVSSPVPLFVGQALGMEKMPDQQSPILPSPVGNAYSLFVTGVLPSQPGGIVSVFATDNLTNASSYSTQGIILSPPLQKHGTGSCNPSSGDDCADYIGMEAVFPGTRPIGFYIADQGVFATDNKCSVHGAFWGQLGVATASANYESWTRLGPTLRATPVPTSCPTNGGPLGFNQPTIIKIGNDYYAYFWLPKTTGISVARATAGSNALPQSWSTLNGGRWTTVPSSAGVQTMGSADVVVQAPSYVTMPWVSYNNYLQTYLMTMITHDGFYYSKLEKNKK